MLTSQDGVRVALIVNDMAELNVDAMLVKSSSQLITGKDKMIEMHTGFPAEMRYLKPHI